MFEHEILMTGASLREVTGYYSFLLPSESVGAILMQNVRESMQCIKMYETFYRDTEPDLRSRRRSNELHGVKRFQIRADATPQILYCVCVCVFVQVEPVGPGYRAAVSDGHHPGGDRDQRLAAHQSHHHQDYEGVKDSTRFIN